MRPVVSSEDFSSYLRSPVCRHQCQHQRQTRRHSHPVTGWPAPMAVCTRSTHRSMVLALADRLRACVSFATSSEPVEQCPGCSAIASTSTGSGYFLLNQFRGTTPFGRATLTPNACATPTDLASTSGGGNIVSIASTQSGNGVWGVDRLGGVEICGDAVSYGSNPVSNKPIVGIVATPRRKGYGWRLPTEGSSLTGTQGFMARLGRSDSMSPSSGWHRPPTAEGIGSWRPMAASLRSVMRPSLGRWAERL